MTSHSSQGQTADRVLVHVDTGRGHEALVNRRFAYVAVSRGRHDARIYTDDRSRLVETLSRDVSHRSALPTERAQGRSTAAREQAPSRGEVSSHMRAAPSRDAGYSR